MATMQFTFPPLRAALLQSLLTMKEQIDVDPSFIDQSPYDNEAKEILRTIFKPKEVEVIKEVEVYREAKGKRGRPTKDVALSSDDQELVIQEIKDLLEQLNNLGAGEATLDTGERIKVITTKANLIDRVLKMQERIFSVKHIADFQDTIMGILDDLVDEKSRATFLKRLEKFRNE